MLFYKALFCYIICKEVTLMSHRAIINRNTDNEKIIEANKYFFENHKKYTFFCPDCKCEMKIQRRRLDNGEYSYYFFSNAHNKENCSEYKRGIRRAGLRTGTPTCNHGIFFDQKDGNENNPPGEDPDIDEDFEENNGEHAQRIEFHNRQPRLNNIKDYIRYIVNSSLEEDTINVGTVNDPDFRFVNNVLFRWNNYENYHPRNLNGIGVLWGGRRFNASAEKIRYEKDSIFVKEDLPVEKHKDGAKPILFEIVFSSENTKNDFLEKYLSFDPKTTILILVGDWERQPNQKGYRIYRSNIGRKCYRFVEKDELDNYIE